MPKKGDLATIAQLMRSLVDRETSSEAFLTGLWHLTRRAMDEGAFREVRFTELCGYFSPHRESETYNTRLSLFSGGPSVTPNLANRLPVTMLEAMEWLAANSALTGMSRPKELPRLAKAKAVDATGKETFGFHNFSFRGGTVSQRICYPSRDEFRPHVELLASLIEAAGQGRPAAGKKLAGSRRRKSHKPKAESLVLELLRTYHKLENGEVDRRIPATSGHAMAKLSDGGFSASAVNRFFRKRIGGKDGYLRACNDGTLAQWLTLDNDAIRTLGRAYGTFDHLTHKVADGDDGESDEQDDNGQHRKRAKGIKQRF